MLSQNTALWLRQKWIHSGLPKAFVSSAGILNSPITSLPVDNFHDRALWCKSTGINYNMHGWILCRYCATGWFWWISGLRAVTMWSSSSFTKRVMTMSMKKRVQGYLEQTKHYLIRENEKNKNELFTNDIYIYINKIYTYRCVHLCVNNHQIVPVSA